MLQRLQTGVADAWIQREKRWLLIIVGAGAVLRLAMAVYLGNAVEPTPAAHDQIFFHDMALNLVVGKGFVFTRPPWPFIQAGAPTAYVSFLYASLLAAFYAVFGPLPVAARIAQALLCSMMPWQIYRLVPRILGQQAAWEKRVGPVALVAAAITAGYAYFVYFSATLMTEGLYLMMVVWALSATLDLVEQPTGRRWVSWGLAVGLASLLRQVFIPIAGLLLLYVLLKAGRWVKVRHLALAGGVVALLILPWTVRNYLVFGRFLLLNSQAGQVFWNANHPALGVDFDTIAMFRIPEDLQGADEVELNNELMRRGLLLVAQDPWRFVRLSLSRAASFFRFWPLPQSSLFSNVSRTMSFAICLPFMAAGLVLSAAHWRRWLLLYLFIAAYTFIHIISWAGIRYRMPVDVALVPFAALAVVMLLGWVRARLGSTQRRKDAKVV